MRGWTCVLLLFTACVTPACATLEGALDTVIFWDDPETEVDETKTVADLAAEGLEATADAAQGPLGAVNPYLALLAAAAAGAGATKLRGRKKGK